MWKKYENITANYVALYENFLSGKGRGKNIEEKFSQETKFFSLSLTNIFQIFGIQFIIHTVRWFKKSRSSLRLRVMLNNTGFECFRKKSLQGCLNKWRILIIAWQKFQWRKFSPDKVWMEDKLEISSSRDVETTSFSCVNTWKKNLLRMGEDLVLKQEKIRKYQAIIQKFIFNKSGIPEFV